MLTHEVVACNVELSNFIRSDCENKLTVMISSFPASRLMVRAIELSIFYLAQPYFTVQII